VAELVPARVAEFLAERLGAGVERAEVLPLSGDASTRRYFRVASGDGTVVLALYPESFDPEELSFAVVRSLIAGYGLPVPEIHDHDGARGILLLQDLGDETLQQTLRTASPSQRHALYREALEQLITLQRRAASGPQRAVCFQVAFDVEKLSWELHYFLKHFLEGHRKRDLSAEDRAVFGAAFHRLAEEIASWPRVLCHRDFHSRNLMPCDGTVYWIDFQDARMGPATYDLASLLRDSYVDLGEDFVRERAEEFRQWVLPDEPREVFERRFELMSIQRNLKALGTFGYMDSVRGNRVYLPYIPGTLASVRRNLERHPELLGLRRALARHIEELA
jgi:aminoglycoside/choline kinase family phosphotransferase